MWIKLTKNVSKIVQNNWSDTTECFLTVSSGALACSSDYACAGRRSFLEEVHNGADQKCIVDLCLCKSKLWWLCTECLWLLVLLHFKHPTLLFNLNILVTSISLLSFYHIVYPKNTKACSPLACENEWHPQQKQMGILSWICRTVWSQVYHQLPATRQQYSKLDGSLEMTTQVTMCTISVISRSIYFFLQWLE